jgi:hypothetical protein
LGSAWRSLASDSRGASIPATKTSAVSNTTSTTLALGSSATGESPASAGAPPWMTT